MQPLDQQSRAFLVEINGEQTIADAILDRIIHDAHRLELRGQFGV